ncbi:hypothetical protein [Streptomyces sp. NPDC051567]|uniref:hypothetical protein n=1 Tax=Streptomyces sp. NPDC051567 TaxID=3365660 RepID=UPI0037A3109F
MHRVLTAVAAAALVLATALPATAHNIRFYVYEVPDPPGTVKVVDIVSEYPDFSEQVYGTCKNVHGTGEFFNGTGRTVYLYPMAACQKTEQFPPRRVKDRERLATAGFQSVFVGEAPPSET